jgi:HAD superfamily hydrolase (TIGR01509 family)
MEQTAAITCRKNWVFDLDGTLTLPVHDFAAIRTALGVPPTEDILGFLAGRPLPEAERLHGLLHRIELDLIQRTAPAPGAHRLMAALVGRGDRVGILTRNSREIALQTLARIGVDHFFPPDHILGRDEAAPKPDPDGLHKLAAAWNVPSSAMVMVGDYLFDLQCGRAAGTATINVDPSGTSRWPELADLTVVSLESLADYLAAC